MKMKVMICTSMRGLHDFEIQNNILAAKDFVEKEFMDVEFVNNYINYTFSTLDNEGDSYALMCLGAGLTNVMSGVNAVVFAPGFLNSRGCIIEALAAKSYGKTIIALQRNYETGEIEIMPEHSFNTNLKIVLNAMVGE